VKVSDWGERLLGFAIACLAAALLLSWAWMVLRPLVPVLLVVLVVYGVLRWYGR
jgi:hypothetical protein